MQSTRGRKSHRRDSGPPAVAASARGHAHRNSSCARENESLVSHAARAQAPSGCPQLQCFERNHENNRMDGEQDNGEKRPLGAALMNPSLEQCYKCCRRGWAMVAPQSRWHCGMLYSVYGARIMGSVTSKVSGVRQCKEEFGLKSKISSACSRAFTDSLLGLR